MMEREHFQNEWDDDTERGPVDQHLIGGEAEHAAHLQQLHHIVGDRRRERGDTRPISNAANVRGQPSLPLWERAHCVPNVVSRSLSGPHQCGAAGSRHSAMKSVSDSAFVRRLVAMAGYRVDESRMATKTTSTPGPTVIDCCRRRREV